ncbi:MAG: LysR family transcriptional regulator [Desertimonas sp.]
MDTLRNLEVRHLIALDAVARLGSFGRAAAELGYTQSAVSQQIAAFERLLDGSLFDRPGGPRPVTLTPLGERMLDHARSLIGRVEQTAVDLDSFRDGRTGRLRIGTFESINTALLPGLIADLLAERPGADIELRDNVAGDHLVGWLRDGHVDVSFVIGANGDPGELDSVSLLTDPYLVVGRAGDLPDRALTPDDLSGVRMIGDVADVLSSRLDDDLRAQGIEPNYVFRTPDNGARMAMAKAGLGVAILPRMAIDRDDPALAIRPLATELEPRDIRVGWMARRTLSPLAARFVVLACERCGVVAPVDLTG